MEPSSPPIDRANNYRRNCNKVGHLIGIRLCHNPLLLSLEFFKLVLSAVQAVHIFRKKTVRMSGFPLFSKSIAE